MFQLIESSVRTLNLNTNILEIAYELYLNAPQSSYPVIDLRELSRRSGASLLECRNAIVEANQLKRFPDCSLHT